MFAFSRLFYAKTYFTEEGEKFNQFCEHFLY